MHIETDDSPPVCCKGHRTSLLMEAKEQKAIKELGCIQANREFAIAKAAQRT
jgi:hypothetical protein